MCLRSRAAGSMEWNSTIVHSRLEIFQKHEARIRGTRFDVVSDAGDSRRRIESSETGAIKPYIATASGMDYRCGMAALASTPCSACIASDVVQT